MKFFLVALLVAVAAAEPEADSDAFLYKTATPYSGLYSGIYSGLNTGYPGYPYSTYNGAAAYQPSIYNRNVYGFNYYKRDAEADADSDAFLYRTATPYSGVYSGYNGYTGYTGLPIPAARYNTYSTLNRAFYQPSIYNRNIYGQNYFKRDADADSDAFLYRTATPYSGVYSGYNGYTGYTGLPIPAARYNTYSTYNGAAAYQPSIYNRNILGYNRFFKRDADADADSDAFLYRTATPYSGVYSGYNGYTGYTGLPISAARYNTYSTYNGAAAYQPSIYNRNILGYNRFFKRDADADADAATVFKQGTFHTNLHNLQKGVHNQRVTPYAGHQLYNTYTPQYVPQTSYVQSPSYIQSPYMGYSNWPLHY